LSNSKLNSLKIIVFLDEESFHHESFRQDRKLEDCQCVPSFQCPSENIVNLADLIGPNSSNLQQTSEEFQQLQTTTNSGFPAVVTGTGFSGIKDYSILIDPRTLPKEILAQEDSDDTLDLSIENTTTERLVFYHIVMAFGWDLRVVGLNPGTSGNL